MNETITMPDDSIYRIHRGAGPKRRPRTPADIRRLKVQAKRDQQATVVRLSDYIARPLPHAWEDGRIGKQRWWGNLLNRATELVDSENPPPFAVTFQMAEVLAWSIVDLYEDRGLPVELPEPPTPIQMALLRERAA
jgi:hypothetical protein